MLLPLKQFLFWCLGGSAVVVPTSLMTAYYAGNQSYSFNSSSSASQQSLQQVPFDSLDASKVCAAEAEEKFEGRLLHSSVNWHSTRFQESRNVFVVMLDANVGTYAQQESANIYCYVNPRTEDVSYFKAYDANNQPMLSNAINMEAMLKSFSKD